MKWASGAVGMVFLLPIVGGMEGTKGDSSFTSVEVMGGAGSYAYFTRGCEGQVLTREDVPFREVGVSVDHRRSNHFQFGMKGGWYSEPARLHDGWSSRSWSGYYANPNVALEWQGFGIGLGTLLSEAPLYDLFMSVEYDEGHGIKVLPTGHLRIGSRRQYFSLHLLEGQPLVSGSGLVAGGFGFSPRPGASYWIGVSTPPPYDGFGLLGEGAIPVGRNTRLRLGLRYGSSEGMSEYAGSLGLDYRWISAGGGK